MPAEEKDPSNAQGKEDRRRSNPDVAKQAMIPASLIQDLAASIAREFHPQRIILFGSHARGEATPDSDVDLLVLMPRNGQTRHAQITAILTRCHLGFPVDVLVRTREEFEERLAMNDWFMRDIQREGKVLYEN